MSYEYDALCRKEGVPLEVFFEPDPFAQRLALSYCVRCPVREACLEAAMAEETTFHKRVGVVGGMTGADRRRLAKRRKDEARRSSDKS